MDRAVVRGADAVRSVGHDLRGTQGLLWARRVRLVLRLRPVAQSWICRGLGCGGALSAVCALGTDAVTDRQDRGVLQPDLHTRRDGAGWRRAVRGTYVDPVLRP